MIVYKKISARLFKTYIVVGWAMMLFFTCHAKPEPPNILFCLADDATWKHLSAYGATLANTPAFDRVAGHGLLFMNAYTPNAKCAPSRAIILTGRNSWQLEEAANHLAFFPTKFKTYAEALAEVGYKVGYTGKGWAPGTAKTAAGKPRELLVAAFNSEKFGSVPTTGISKIDYVANFEKFLDARKEGQRFCFWYGGHEPHRAYEYGSGARLGGKKTSDIRDLFGYWPDVDSVRNDLLDYALELEYFDRQLGGMIAALERRGELENTLIVVTSDNGMPFPRVKGQQYEHSHHLPLAVMWPKGIKKPGRQVREMVSFSDFAATFVEVAGYTAEALGMQPIEGKSLMDIFKNQIQKGTRDFVVLGKERHDVGRPHNAGYPVRGIVEGGFLYLKNFKPERWPAGNPETGYLNTDGSPTKSVILNLRRSGADTTLWTLNFGKRPSEELYFITSDEDCLVNLANDPAYAEIKAKLAKKMETELKRQGDPRMFGKGDVFDTYRPNNGDGFYERFMSGEAPNAGWVNPTDFEKQPLDGGNPKKKE